MLAPAFDNGAVIRKDACPCWHCQTGNQRHEFHHAGHGLAPAACLGFRPWPER